MNNLPCLTETISFCLSIKETFVFLLSRDNHVRKIAKVVILISKFGIFLKNKFKSY